MKKLVNCLIFQFAFLVCVSAQEETPSIPLEEDSAFSIDLSSKPLVKDNKIVLQWKCRGFEKNGFSIIERSSDEKNYETIGVIKTTGSQVFEFTDEKPTREKNYYRIKINAGSKTFISRTISADGRSNFACKFYPNPVDKLLIVKTEYAGELQITDALNKSRISQQLQPGLQIVDVSALDKGLYIITISHNSNSTVITEKLVKI